MDPGTVAEANKSQEYIKKQQLAPTHKKNYYHRPTRKNSWVVKQDVTATRKINTLTYCREQSPSWEVNRFSASHEIPRILRDPKFHYCVDNCRHLPLAWARSIQSMPLPSHFLMIHLNIILHSTPRSTNKNSTEKLDMSCNIPYPKSMDSHCTA
jgi:hypothetical protein